MLEGPVDDQMIEIGDPTEEPTLAESAPQVVIEYHERGGVPWMLIPPLLVLSAVGAILLYTKLAPRPTIHPTSALVKAVDVAEPPADGPEPVVPPIPAPSVESPAVPATVVVPETMPDQPPPPVAIPSDPVELAPEPAKAAEPAPFPRVQGLGFDPKAFEAERKVEAPADPALAAVAREDRPDDRDLPREIDPDLLPPDPREAKVRQQQRKLELARKVEEERVRYHADLRAICRKFREDSGPELLELKKQYDLKIDPKAEKAAVELLGKSGKFAGADRRTRIDLLRSLGYPEPVILDNLYYTYEKQQIGERDGPRHPGEAYYFSALFLLRNPPRQATPPTRPVSAPSNGAVSAR